MIDLAKIIEKIEARLVEMGTTAAEVSAKATDSKDTIRNWKRALDTDRKTGTRKASATTIKLNQIESAIGIELARNSNGATPEQQLRSALLSFGVDAEDLNRAVSSVRVFVDDPDEQSSEGPLDGQSSRASRRREEVPSR